MISTPLSAVLKKVQAEIPCQHTQLQQLALYYNHHQPYPPILVAHGLEHTGKLEVILALFKASEINHGVIKSQDCLSQRHLITKIFAVCARQSGATDSMDRFDRIDNLNSLVVNLQRLFENTSAQFVLVIDGVERQRGMSHTLLSALARLGDMVPRLSVILTTSSSRTLILHRSGIPFVYFPPYTRAEAITIITKEQPPIPQNLPDTFPEISKQQLANIYATFVTTVYDTLITHTSSTSIHAFRQICKKLWPRFIWPLLSGETPPNKSMYKHSTNIKWDFARLLSRNRALFQLEGEKALLPHLTSNTSEIWTFEQLLTQHEKNQNPQQSTNELETSEPKQESPPLLKSFPTLLLVSSYLASHTAQKHDIILFSRLSSSSTIKRKYLTSALSKSRAGGVRKTPTKKKPVTDGTLGDETPSKKRRYHDTTNGGNGEGLAGEKTPRSTRLLLEKTSNIPRPFTLERVVAILRTIHPEGLPRSKGAADRVYAEMSELERLRLVVRAAGDGGRTAGDEALLEERWRVNVSREFVVEVGRGWGLSLEGWEID